MPNDNQEKQIPIAEQESSSSLSSSLITDSPDDSLSFTAFPPHSSAWVIQQHQQLSAPLVQHDEQNSDTATVEDGHQIDKSKKIILSPTSSDDGYDTKPVSRWFLLRSYCTTGKGYLYLASLALLIGWIFNNIGWIYCSMYSTQTYSYWLNQSTAVTFIVMQSPVVLYRLYWSKSITPEMRATVHWKVYAIMGLFDALYNLLTCMSSPYVSAPAQNLLFQLPIPIAMAAVKVVWPVTRYKRGQYLGAFIIVIGATVSVLPSLISPADESEGGQQQDNRPSAILVYIVGVVFYALGIVYKEHSLKNALTIDYWYVSWTENIWNFFFGFAFWPLLWLPGVSVDTPSNSWSHFVGGAKCMFEGVAGSDAPGAQCQYLFLISCIWILSNVFVNIMTLIICRIGDSVIVNIINSVQLPLSNLCFASSAIMTTALVSDFSPWMWVAVVVVFVGFIIYQFIPLQHVPPTAKSNDTDDNTIHQLVANNDDDAVIDDGVRAAALMSPVMASDKSATLPAGATVVTTLSKRQQSINTTASSPDHEVLLSSSTESDVSYSQTK